MCRQQAEQNVEAVKYTAVITAIWSSQQESS